MAEEVELPPDKTDELHRLCDEYAIATNCVVKTLRVVNPLERVNLFLLEEQKAAAVMAKIKELLTVERSL